MIVTKKWIEKNYNEFNRRYFDGVLPQVKFHTSHSQRRWGYAAYVYDMVNNTVTPYSLTISNYYDTSERVKQNTLLHEMIHIYEYYTYPERFVRHRKHERRYDAHGKFFQTIARRINRDGWNISKYVSYEDLSNARESKVIKVKNNRKQNDAVICVCLGNYTSLMFKTDIPKLNKFQKTLNECNDGIEQQIGKINNITYYTFNNRELSRKRSCIRQLRGWQYTNKEIDYNLSNWNASKICV